MHADSCSLPCTRMPAESPQLPVVTRVILAHGLAPLMQPLPCHCSAGPRDGAEAAAMAARMRSAVQSVTPCFCGTILPERIGCLYRSPLAHAMLAMHFLIAVLSLLGRCPGDGAQGGGRVGVCAHRRSGAWPPNRAPGQRFPPSASGCFAGGTGAAPHARDGGLLMPAVLHLREGLKQGSNACLVFAHRPPRQRRGHCAARQVSTGLQARPRRLGHRRGITRTRPYLRITCRPALCGQVLLVKRQ